MKKATGYVRIRKLALLGLLVQLILVSCGSLVLDSTVPTVKQKSQPKLNLPRHSAALSDPEETTEPEFQSITIPVSVYILDDETGTYSSQRTADEIQDVYEQVNRIWAPAGIMMEIRIVTRMQVTPDVLDSIASGDFHPFYVALHSNLDLQQPSLINAFYVREIGGSDSMFVEEIPMFFVVDDPLSSAARVTAHEIAHILGLDSTFQDETRLLYPDSNGVVLTLEEIEQVRIAALRLLNEIEEQDA